MDKLKDDREAKRLRQIQADLRELQRPFMQLKCEIMAVSIQITWLHQNGKTESFYSPDVVRQLEEVDKLWEETRQAYFQNRDATRIFLLQDDRN